MGTLFARPHDLPPGFEDHSTYCFTLADEAFPGLKAAAAPKAPPPEAKGPVFRPNIVLTRERTGATLADFVKKERADLAERGTKFTVLREGPFTVAGLPAHQAEIAVSIEKPPAKLVQWQVVVLREGFAYSFFATTTESRFEKDRPRFAAFVAGWH